MERDVTPDLSIVMATYDDFDGCEFTLTFLRNELTGRGIADQVELLVVNNNPDSYDGKRIAALCAKVGANHIPFGEKQGSAAPRDLAIRSAKGKWVACCDCHIQFLFGVLPQLLEFCRTTESRDMFHGPLCTEQMIQPDGKPSLVWTHWEPVWGNNGMLGKQAGFSAEKLAEGNPIEILGAGLGLFLVMREHWTGFLPDLEEFGSEELCIHQGYRIAGRKVWLLPWMKWWHKFRDTSKPVPYQTHYGATCKNYLRWHKAIGFPALSGIRAVYVGFDWLKVPQEGRNSLDTWKLLLQEVGIDEGAALQQERDGKIPTLLIELPNGQRAVPPMPGPPPPEDGPGSELEAINKEYFGVEPNPECNCAAKIRQMNQWGVAGCRANYWTIVGWMKDGESQFGWRDKIAAGVNALVTLNLFRFKSADPWPGLVTEAINRAEAKQTKAQVAA